MSSFDAKEEIIIPILNSNNLTKESETDFDVYRINAIKFRNFLFSLMGNGVREKIEMKEKGIRIINDCVKNMKRTAKKYDFDEAFNILNIINFNKHLFGKFRIAIIDSKQITYAEPRDLFSKSHTSIHNNQRVMTNKSSPCGLIGKNLFIPTPIFLQPVARNKWRVAYFSILCGKFVITKIHGCKYDVLNGSYRIYIFLMESDELLTLKETILEFTK